MDPRRALGAPVDELRGLDPLARARVAMQAGEAAEQREAEDQAEADRAGFEMKLAQVEMIKRSEIAQQGYTSEELSRARLERDQVRAAQVAEHLDALRRLDPARFGDGAEVSRMALAMPDGSGEVVISAGNGPRPVDPAEVLARNAAEAAAWESPEIRRMRIASLESETGRAGRDRMPTRASRPLQRGRRPARPVTSAAGGGPVTLGAGGGPVPPRSITRADELMPPEPAVGGPHMAPGDW